MKSMQKVFVAVAVISVFLISFFIGRATALRDKEERNNSIINNAGVVNLPKSFTDNSTIKDTPAAAGARVKADEEPSEKQAKETSQQIEEPTHMLFPCTDVVLKDYAENAVYSETMKDWRAHTGIDYACEKQSDIKSSWDGIVLDVYKDKLWGHCIDILHGKSIIGKYKNLSKEILVKKGDYIKRGQVIAQAGSSAAIESKETTHLHFELWQDGVPINPQSYVY